MIAKIILVTLALCLFYSTASEGMSLMKTATELRCQCVKTQSTFIHPRLYQSVELIPSGPHCKNVEVIITITSGERVCVDPSAPWVEKIIKKILESQENNDEPAI